MHRHVIDAVPCMPLDAVPCMPLDAVPCMPLDAVPCMRTQPVSRRCTHVTNIFSSPATIYILLPAECTPPRFLYIQRIYNYMTWPMYADIICAIGSIISGGVEVVSSTRTSGHVNGGWALSVTCCLYLVIIVIFCNQSDFNWSVDCRNISDWKNWLRYAILILRRKLTI